MYKVLVSNDKQEIWVGISSCCRFRESHIALPISISWHFRYDSRVDRDSRSYDLYVAVLCFSFHIAINKWSTGYGKPWKRKYGEQSLCKECDPLKNLNERNKNDK